MKNFKFVNLLLILLILSLPSCVFDTGSGNNDYAQWEYEIEQTIYSIYQGLDNENIFQIMENYSTDFLHNDFNYNDEEARWYNRFETDQVSDVTNIHVSFFTNSYAKVSYSIKLNGNYYQVNSLSDLYSDVTIFRREGEFWKVYGNQNYNENYNVNVDSYPDGARIYIDGNFMGKTTPATIEDISPGQYNIGVYLRGYNEISETIYVDEDIYKNYDLQIPSEPIPDITIISPENGETFNSDEFLLNGYINNFEGNEAILTYNGVEYPIEVDAFNDFRTYIYLTQSENTFFIRATNINGNTGTTEDYTVFWN